MMIVPPYSILVTNLTELPAPALLGVPVASLAVPSVCEPLQASAGRCTPGPLAAATDILCYWLHY
jgi:hypothetical protein